jgi:hypothetical protein
LNSSNKKEIVDNGKKPEIIKRNPEELIKPEENSPVEGLNKKKLWVMKFLKHQNLHQ